MEGIAVIDIGSNSVRMMLLEDGKEEQYLATTRLGQGAAQHRLMQEPMERTAEAIERFVRLAEERGAGRVLAFATCAVRDADNRGELLDLVRRRCGLKIDVLPGEAEAQLAYLGAAGGARACVADIGGASTELVAGEGEVRCAVSLTVGAVRLHDDFLQDRAGASSFLDGRFAGQKERFAPWSDAPLLGVGGTVTTLAAMQRGMEKYDAHLLDGAVLTRAQAGEWVDRLWEMPASRRVFPGLSPQRADIIAHGALIVERLLSALSREEIRVSTGDNLRGYLAWRGIRP